MKALAQNTLIQNRYLIVQLIGKGGMGEVYLAVDQRLGSAVALKRTYFAGDVTLANAFEREARILARMRHPVLPKVSDHFGEKEEQYLVMEHISGDDLSKRLEAAQKPFPLSWVMFWADQLLDALTYLHSHEPPIIHRDIKPQNLKLTDENHVILLDFGLSKSSTQSHLRNSGSSGGTSGSVLGYTPHYAPMEQIRGIGTSPRSDIYSLSATLYQLMTNTVPVDALSRADSLLNGISDPIEPPYKLNPEIPQSVSDVILQGMEVSQDKRFATAREMQKDLRKAFSQMQEGMQAQTVAFNVPAANAPPAANFSQSPVTDSGRVSAPISGDVGIGSTPLPAQATDFDDTLAYAPETNANEVRQADVKTEVFLARDSFTPPVHTEQPAANQTFEEPQQAEPGSFSDYANTTDYGSASPSGFAEQEQNDFGPGGTVPLVVFDDQAASTARDTKQEYVQDFGAADAYAQPDSSDDEAVVATPAPIVAPVKKKSATGKIIGIFVGLFALFFLLGGIGFGGWYYYTYVYSAGVIEEPTPTPLPTEEISPTPEPTLAVVESNTNTDISNTNTKTNTNTTVFVEPTPEPTPRQTELPRQTPQPDRTPVRPPQTPGTRSTPRPTPRRTSTPQILQ